MPSVTREDQVVPEDLTLALMQSDVKKTPVFMMIPKGDRPEDEIFRWGITGYGDRRPRGVPDNKDVDAFEGDSGKKLANRVQRFWRTPSVSVKAEKLTKSDVVLKYNGQIVKKIAEAKRDIEYRLLSTADSHEDDGVIGDEFKCLGHAIDDGTLTDTDLDTAIPAPFKTPPAQIYTGALSALTEINFRDMAKGRFDALGQTGEFVVVCGSDLKARISDTFGNYVADRAGFTVTARTDKSQFDMKRFMMSTIDVIETEFGTFVTVLSSYIGSDGIGGLPNLKYGYGLDMEGLRIRPLMYADHTEFEYRGGGRRGLIDSIFGYEYGDPRMHLKIAPSS